MLYIDDKARGVHEGYLVTPITKAELVFGLNAASAMKAVLHGEAACGSALLKGERVVVEDVAGSPIFAGTPALAVMLEAEARAVQSTPLVSRSGKLLGMFSTHYRTARRPTERDIRLLDVLARQAADLIERKRSEEIRGQLSAIVESTGDAIYIYDFAGTILNVEPRGRGTLWLQGAGNHWPKRGSDCSAGLQGGKSQT